MGLRRTRTKGRGYRVDRGTPRSKRSMPCGLGVTVEPVELAATLRVAEIPPVGGLVAGAGDRWSRR